ncbi:Acyl-[acyl-carrier-protein] hydrolase [Heracleum sosnowskyi]|uniref:Acyl-[acyl-carrier-protein] hydrolase n=1 Tax=Heracleum sosnowskyi TaxID=360622 RepID=A0AAD8N2M4_9APIA|nr:Acyl-[acyl-carrier-protein] hydrolase [Heracleum sosnowskyi]
MKSLVNGNLECVAPGSSEKITESVRRDWLLRDYNIGEILTRASSCWVMMNKRTRKLFKLPDEVRAKIGNYFVDTPPIVDEDSRRLPKLTDNNADYIRTGLTPRWNDLDINQHVNNVKYVGWILEIAPLPVVESHELASMTLEYRRECMGDSVLDSLTSVIGNGLGDLATFGQVECQHLIRLKDGAEIVKGRTEWRPKRAYGIGSFGQLPEESTWLPTKLEACMMCYYEKEVTGQMSAPNYAQENAMRCHQHLKVVSTLDIMDVHLRRSLKFVLLGMLLCFRGLFLSSGSSPSNVAVLIQPP